MIADEPIYSITSKITTTVYQLPITNYQLPITNYQLPITNYQLPITNYQQNSSGRMRGKRSEPHH